MIEAVMFWNEPNNKSHWDFQLDPDWRSFAAMVKLAAQAIAQENSRLLRVLGGISPIDPISSATWTPKASEKEEPRCQAESKSQPTTVKSAAGSRNGAATLPP